jgi:acyl carrier protein
VGQSSSIEGRATDEATNRTGVAAGAAAAGTAPPGWRSNGGVRDRRAALTAAAAAAIADQLGVPVDAVSTTAPFTDLGLSSAQLARLTAVLEDALGVEVSLTALYDHPDIEQLAEHLVTP